MHKSKVIYKSTNKSSRNVYSLTLSGLLSWYRMKPNVQTFSMERINIVVDEERLIARRNGPGIWLLSHPLAFRLRTTLDNLNPIPNADLIGLQTPMKFVVWTNPGNGSNDCPWNKRFVALDAVNDYGNKVIREGEWWLRFGIQNKLFLQTHCERRDR